VSRGWGIRQRELISKLAVELTRPERHTRESAYSWIWVDHTESWEPGFSVARSSARRRAAQTLAEAQVIEVRTSWAATEYRTGRREVVSAGRWFAQMRFPASLPLEPAEVISGSEVEGHFEGLAETLDDLTELALSAAAINGLRWTRERASLTAHHNRKEARVFRRLDYHRDSLGRLPTPSGAFGWEWVFAQWMIARGDFARLRAKCEPLLDE